MSRSFVVLALTLLACTALAQTSIEISPDGRTTAFPDGTGAVRSATTTTDSVPFNSTPDWNCDLRMQVGGLAVGDLNRDERPDVAVACYRSNSYPPYPDWRNFVLYNQGGQLQSPPGWWTADSVSSTDVRIADFNKDTIPDMFFANGDGSFPGDAIYFGTVADTLRRLPGWRATNATWTTGAAVADFDNDGDIDVATSNQAVSPDPYRPVSLFVNNNGSLETYPSWTSLASEISSGLAWGDINSDGYPDLAVSKWVNFNSGVYRNNQGALERSPFWTGNTTQGQKGIAWADVNGDSLLDLAIGGSIPTQLYMSTGGTLGSAPVWTSQNASHGTQDLAWGDVDGDGDPDLATAEFSTGHFRIYLNRNGVLDQSPSWQYDSPNVGTALAFGDINGDGRTDLVIGVSGQPCVSVFYNRLVTGVSDEPIPAEACLEQNYPNPFNPLTTITFRLPHAGDVTLRLFDLLGRDVATLVNERRGAGSHTVSFDASGFPSGVYLYRLQTGARTETKRMVVVR